MEKGTSSLGERLHFLGEENYRHCSSRFSLGGIIQCFLLATLSVKLRVHYLKFSDNMKLGESWASEKMQNKLDDLSNTTTKRK